jgi:hypothetical protein
MKLRITVLLEGLHKKFGLEQLDEVGKPLPICSPRQPQKDYVIL